MITRRVRIGVGMCVHNEQDYIEFSIRAVYGFADVIAISINTGVPWGGEYEELDSTVDIVSSFPDPSGKIRLHTGQWRNEVEQRNANLDTIRGDIDYYMVVDADEIYTCEGLRRLRRFIAWRPHIGQFRTRLVTYWKTNPFCRIEPPEPLRAHAVSRVRKDTRFVDLRRTNEFWRATVPRSVAVCHHFSYARSSEKILQKLRNFSHREEVVPNWYQDAWLRWDSDRELTNLHPTHPWKFRQAVRVEPSELPEVMRSHPFAKPR